DHERYVYSLAISPDGTLLASGGADSRIYLHNLVDGTVRLMLEGAEYDAFFSLAFSPDGKTLAAGNMNGEIYLIDVLSGTTTGAPLTGHDTIFGLAFRPDGKMLASSGCAQRLTNCMEGEVILWDPVLHTMLGNALTGFPNEIRSIEFSQDGSLLVGGYWKSVALWNTTIDQPLAQNLFWERGSTSGFVLGSDFSSDGRFLAASIANLVGIWNAAEGEPVNVNMTGHAQEVRAMRFSPDGSTLYTASKDKTLIQWDAATGTEIGRPITGDMGVFLKATFSPDGSLMAYIVQGKLTILAAHTGAVIAQIPVEKMGGIAFNPEGTQVAVYGCTQEAEQADEHGIKECLLGGVLVYEVSTGTPVDLGLTPRPGRITGFAFSQDGKLLAIGGEDRQILLWDREAQAVSGAAVDLAGVWTGKYGFPYEIAYSPDGKYLVVGNKIEAQVLVIDLAARAPVGQPIDPCLNFSQFAFSPDGQTLVVGCTGIQLYDMLRLELGEKIGQDGENSVYDGFNSVSSLAFSPDGRYLMNGDTYEEVHVWDLAIHPAQAVATLRGHASDLTDLAVAEAGKVLISVSTDATINRWDISALGGEPGTPVELPLIDQPVQGYANQNANVAFSLDASLFVSASCRISLNSFCQQAEVQVYALPSGQKLSSFQIDGKRGKFALRPDGQMLAFYISESATSADLEPPGRVVFWDLEQQEFAGSPIEGLKGDSYALQYSPDGKTIAVSTSVSGAIYQASGSRELLFQLSSGAYSFAFSSDGSYLAEGLSRSILIREMQQGKLVGPPLTGGFVLTYGLSFNHAGTQLV
ncbi:MAG: WD40 repeat domain-containing protein, partial [Chloroflexota bacterium]